MLVRRTSHIFSINLCKYSNFVCYYLTSDECVEIERFLLYGDAMLTAKRKSPGDRPAISATPPGSTSSKYWRPGHRSVGLSCISGDAALAPRNTKPNPLLARCRTTVFASIIPLFVSIKRKCINKICLFQNNFRFCSGSYIFFCRGAVALLYWCPLPINSSGAGCSNESVPCMVFLW